MNPLYLQTDHKVPYEVAGDDLEKDLRPEEYMLVCGECNRAKSWACEHCENWLGDKSSEVCKTCYWANPQHYEHIAQRPERRLVVVWQGGGAVGRYERLAKVAASKGLTLPELVAEVVDGFCRTTGEETKAEAPGHVNEEPGRDG